MTTAKKIPKNKYNQYCWIVGKPLIGKGTWIGAFTVIDGSGGLAIGKECEISSGAHIYTHSTALRCVSEKSFNKDGTKNAGAIKRAPVCIGDYTFIGANATILPGVAIGDHCIIGAGSVVTKDVPPYSVAVGVPATVAGSVRKTRDAATIRRVNNGKKTKHQRSRANLQRS